MRSKRYGVITIGTYTGSAVTISIRPVGFEAILSSAELWGFSKDPQHAIPGSLSHPLLHFCINNQVVNYLKG